MLLISIKNMYGDRMKCSYCGKEEIITPNPDQTIDE